MHEECLSWQVFHPDHEIQPLEIDCWSSDNTVFIPAKCWDIIFELMVEKDGAALMDLVRLAQDKVPDVDQDEALKGYEAALSASSIALSIIEEENMETVYVLLGHVIDQEAYLKLFRNLSEVIRHAINHRAYIIFSRDNFHYSTVSPC